MHVVVTNDVTALAREQLWFGAGRTHTTFGVITVGAGLGFAVVREGQVLEQLIDNGHLLAHSPVDASGPRCGLGHRGCVSAYLNRPDFERRLSHGSGTPRARSARRSATRVWPRARWSRTPPGRWDTSSPPSPAPCRPTGSCWPARTSSRCSPRRSWPATIAERLRPGPEETQRCALDVSTAPLTFTDWARGAAVISVQHVLGAV